MKIELTKERAAKVLKSAFSQYCTGCPLINDCDGRTLGCDANQRLAARVLYGTQQKLDRVEIAKEFMIGILANPITPRAKCFGEVALTSFTAADAFIEVAEKGETK